MLLTDISITMLACLLNVSSIAAARRATRKRERVPVSGCASNEKVKDQAQPEALPHPVGVLMWHVSAGK